ncbi:MAG: DUF6765 family protein [Spirochaetia bacterium]
MNLEFHYYTTYYMAIRAGFSENDAYIIAYSSQYVDNAVLPYSIRTERGKYITEITASYSFWDEEVSRNIYLPFHFMPGDPEYAGAARRDGKRNKYNVTPASNNAKKLLIAALKTRNLYRVGIAIHTYVDTWAHQNFIGLRSPWNSTDPNSLLPPIGHAQTGTQPDQLSGRWEDRRLINANMQVVNRERFLKAAKMMYKYFSTFNKQPYDDADLIMDWYEDFIGTAGNEKQMNERIYNYIISEDIPEYRKNEWLTDAAYVDHDPREPYIPGTNAVQWFSTALFKPSSFTSPEEYSASGDFSQSSLYHWCEAAKEHRAEAHRILHAQGLLPIQNW